MTGSRPAFEAGLGIELDPFQLAAFDALDAGSSVLVAAPTGSGKTVVAEYGVHRALGEGGKTFYTTPLKALSNQKYLDFVRRYGTDRVGLLTGDNAINGDAPVVVMTTEVLRNMIYAGAAALAGLRYVVLDEVHYLQNRYRGAVWEEVIIHLAPEVDLICLSATVSNAEEVADWIATVRGDTAAIIEERRPVELTNLYAVAERGSSTIELLPTFATDAGSGLRPNPEAARRDARRGRRGPGQPAAVPRHRAGRTSSPCSPNARCCPRSASSSAGPPATTPSASASMPACGSRPGTSGGRCTGSPTSAAHPSPTTTSTRSAIRSG